MSQQVLSHVKSPAVLGWEHAVSVSSSFRIRSTLFERNLPIELGCELRNVPVDDRDIKALAPSVCMTVAPSDHNSARTAPSDLSLPAIIRSHAKPFNLFVYGRFLFTRHPMVVVSFLYLTSWICGSFALHCIEPTYVHMWTACYDSWILMLDAPPSTPITVRSKPIATHMTTYLRPSFDDQPVSSSR